jgi:hypothetical protein
MSYFDSTKAPYIDDNSGALVRYRKPALASFGDLFDNDVMEFDSTKFPGICKPANKETLDVVVKFQKQLNRVAQAKGFTKIGPDGDIGPGTLALFRQVQSASSGTVEGNGQSCTGIANQSLPDISLEVEALADVLGAPTTVSGPAPATPPSFVNKQGGLTINPTAGAGSILDVVKGMSTPMKVAMGGITLGIGYLLFTGVSKSKKRK